VKNLDESINDDWLRTQFGKYGTITSARVMRDQTTGSSKGFGFVCYSTPEEASAAIQKLNNKMFMGKPVYVALSQVASQRREMLAVSFQQQQQQRGMIPPMQGAPFYPPPSALGLQQPAYMAMPYGQPMGRPGMMPQGRMPLNPGMMRPMYRMPDYRRQDMGGMEMGGGPRGPGPKQGGYPRNQGGRQRGGPGGRMMQQPGGGPMQGVPGGPMQGHMAPPADHMQPGGYAGAGQEMGGPGGAGGGAGGGAIDPTRLASASVEEQKTILGEQLYPLIVRREPDLAGKITGMILELDNTEILHLLESPESLDEKVRAYVCVFFWGRVGGGWGEVGGAQPGLALPLWAWSVLASVDVCTHTMTTTTTATIATTTDPHDTGPGGHQGAAGVPDVCQGRLRVSALLRSPRRRRGGVRGWRL
jgi:polyadenylate-binding protein